MAFFFHFVIFVWYSWLLTRIAVKPQEKRSLTSTLPRYKVVCIVFVLLFFLNCHCMWNSFFCYPLNLMDIMWLTQRIQYAKTKSDVIAKGDGTFVPRERRKRHDDKGKTFPTSPFSYLQTLFFLSTQSAWAFSLSEKLSWALMSLVDACMFVFCFSSSLCTKSRNDAWDITVFNSGIFTGLEPYVGIDYVMLLASS